MNITTPAVVHDSDIRRQIWQGAIPIVFNIDRHEITSLQSPHPLYVMAPRQSYLTLYIDAVRQHFESFVSSFNRDDVWFQCEDDESPLKWNLPIGVLFDSIMLQRELKQYQSELKSSSSASSTLQKRSSIKLSADGNSAILQKEIPWKITVRFHSFRDTQLIRIKTDNDIQWNFLNAMKEAFYVKYSNTKAIMTLSEQDQMKLWSSIKDARLSEYEEIQQQMQHALVTNNIRNIPIRVINVTESEIRQKLYCIDASEANTDIKTLADFVQMISRDDSSTTDSSSSPFNESGRGHIVIQGISPSLDTSLHWLANNCSHPDHFLYICTQKLLK